MKKSLLLLLFLGLLISACKLNTIDQPQTIQSPIFVDPEGNKTWNIFGLQIIGKVFSEDTHGAYSVIVSTTPPDGGAPPHVHEIEDELFYVLEGSFRFTCGEEQFLANKGAVVVLPKGIPHAFKNVGTTAGRMMNTITPGGFEKFFDEVDQLPKDGPPDPVVLSKLAMKYRLRFIED